MAAMCGFSTTSANRGTKRMSRVRRPLGAAVAGTVSVVTVTASPGSQPRHFWDPSALRLVTVA